MCSNECPFRVIIELETRQSVMLLLDNNTTCYSCNLEKKIKI